MMTEDILNVLGTYINDRYVCGRSEVSSLVLYINYINTKRLSLIDDLTIVFFNCLLYDGIYFMCSPIHWVMGIGAHRYKGSIVFRQHWLVTNYDL